MARQHVLLVNVRSLLSVDFDGDVVFVEDLGNLIVFERFSLHHMTPKTGRVTNRQEDEFAFLLGALKSFRTPWVPVDWVVRVLQQIGAGFTGQSVGGSRVGWVAPIEACGLAVVVLRRRGMFAIRLAGVSQKNEHRPHACQQQRHGQKAHTDLG